MATAAGVPLADVVTEDLDPTCIDSRINFFEKPKTQYFVEQCFETVVNPQTRLGPFDKNIEFFVPGSSHFIQPSEMRLEFSLRILDEDGDVLNPLTAPNPRAEPPVAGFSAAALENGIGACIIKNLDIRLEKSVTDRRTDGPTTERERAREHPVHPSCPFCPF